MFDPFEMVREFFEGLTAIDVAIVERAAEKPCRDCGGPLYRGDYPRKPRGGVLAVAAEGLDRRFSLCCGRDGCRHRTTPPSVRFLGRRVYVGAVVVVASAVALTATAASAMARATGVPARTMRRWGVWWRGPFIESSPFVDLSARLIPAPARSRLPPRCSSDSPARRPSRSRCCSGWLAPLTTTSCPFDGSRWVRGVM